VVLVIRRALERSYNATVGALRNALAGAFGSLSSRMGILQLLYIIALVALMGGFANAVFFPLPNQGQIVYPGTGSQTIPEAVLDTLVILVGGAGIYVAYASGRQTTRSRMVNLYLGIALLLIALSFFMGNYLSNLKG
jgi:heme/copper-type cytochrome/quinol oxidase subunit 3